MSTQFVEPTFDSAGMIIPPSGDSGPATPPATAENTAAAAPSPIPSKTTEEALATIETKTDGVKTPDVKAEGQTPEELDEDEKAAKAEHGEQWPIKQYRKAKAELKRFGPAKDALTNVGSPERLTRGLEFVTAFADPLQPIPQALEKMTALSPSRATELRDHIYNQVLDQHPDTVASHLLGGQITVDEIVQAVNAFRTGEAKPQPTTTETKAITDMLAGTDLEGLEADYPGLPAVIKTMAERLAASEAKPVAAEDPTKSLREENATFKQREQQAMIDRNVAEIEREGNQYYDEVWTVVDEGLRGLGLESDPKDDEETAKLKTWARETIKEKVEPAFDADEENQKMMKRVMDLLAKRDPSAHDYKDMMKLKADLAFRKVADPIIDLYNAKRELQSSAPNRTTSTHKRPEIVGNTVGGNGKTNWLSDKPANITASAWLDKKLAEMPG